MINVTKTFLPPQSEYNAILKRAWTSGWITNRGMLVQELEDKLKSYLNVSSILVTTNGTLPLQIAIKALRLSGEIITTPFSYVATSSSIVWEGCTPVFVDIHPDYLTIDEAKIKEAITPKTTAILATHVFGNPCAIDKIEEIAKNNGLKVIYDAAHCFGVTYKGKSIFEYGDVSTCSFHATKIFHTGEGGAIFANDKKLFDTIFYHHNFGHDGPSKFHGLGINAKMSEFQAAMGLAVFPYIDAIFKDRMSIVKTYQMELGGIKQLQLREGTQWNYSYFPIILDTEEKLLKICQLLKDKGIFPRRYFFPSLNMLPYVKYQSVPISEQISKRVLCIPLFYNMKNEDVNQIIRIINTVK